MIGSIVNRYLYNQLFYLYVNWTGRNHNFFVRPFMPFPETPDAKFVILWIDLFQYLAILTYKHIVSLIMNCFTNNSQTSQCLYL